MDGLAHLVFLSRRSKKAKRSGADVVPSHGSRQLGRKMQPARTVVNLGGDFF
jgi:hypothetical protein